MSQCKENLKVFYFLLSLIYLLILYVCMDMFLSGLWDSLFSVIGYICKSMSVITQFIPSMQLTTESFLSMCKAAIIKTLETAKANRLDTAYLSEHAWNIDMDFYDLTLCMTESVNVVWNDVLSLSWSAWICCRSQSTHSSYQWSGTELASGTGPSGRERWSGWGPPERHIWRWEEIMSFRETAHLTC